MKNNTKLSEKITVGLFFLLLAFLFVGFLIIPKQDFSESENRVLASFPEFSFNNLVSGDFTDKMSDYCADHFPLRNELLYVKSQTELAMLKGENNGVIKGSNGYLIKDSERADEEAVAENISHLYTLYDKLPCQMYFAFAPRSADMLENYLPFDYPTEKTHKLWLEAEKNIRKDESGYIDLHSALSEHIDEEIYYKTDHHWTTLGAYYAYAEIVSSLGDMPYSYSDFTVESASDSFYGTTWSFGCIPFIEPDSIEYMRFTDDESFNVIIPGKEPLNGLYDRQYLEKKDKYSSFITSTVNGYITVRKSTSDSQPADRKTILLIKDSFAHSVAPMLARHYDIIMIDTRYYTPKKGEITSMAENGEIEAVVALFGVNGLNDRSYELYKLINA